MLKRVECSVGVRKATMVDPGVSHLSVVYSSRALGCWVLSIVFGYKWGVEWAWL